MREPAFWSRRGSALSLMLSPVGAIYGAVAASRMERVGVAVRVPVFCVGNMTLGGAGKTPTVLALAHLLKGLGETPVVLSRGYGGVLSGPVEVDPARHTAGDVGDEPLMLARDFAVIVARDRVAGAALAGGRGSVIVMDDGFQNPALEKDCCFVVVDARRGLGNGRIFPAGPLRAPLAPQLRRTDVLIVIGDGDATIEAAGKPTLRARFLPDPSCVDALRGRRVLAFAGIGDPGKFFTTLRDAGIDVAAERAFADHHPYTAGEIARVLDEAQVNGLIAVTTRKDFVRIASAAQAASLAGRIMPFDGTLVFDDETGWRNLVVARLNAARGRVLLRADPAT